MYSSVVEVTVLEAKDLIAADRTGTSDPYVVITIERQKHVTEVREKTLEPKWNQKFQFYTNENNTRPLNFGIFDYDVFSKDDPIGDCSLTPQNLIEGFKGWIPLNNTKSGSIHVEVSSRPLGEDEVIHLSVAEDESEKEARKPKETGEKYWPMKTSVFAPSNFKAEEHHEKMPSIDLKLEFVHGFRGYDCRDNLHVTSGGNLIYHGAALGIVLSTEKRLQHFFHGHNDDIVSLALHPGGQIVATGQVASNKGSRKPKICVWNVKELKTLVELEGFHERSVANLAFSADGKHLLSIGTDDHRSIGIYDWEKKKLLANANGASADINAVKYYPKSSNEFVTCGDKHVKFWKLENDKLTSKDAVFKKFANQTFLAIEFFGKDAITAAVGGEIYFWTGNAVSRIIEQAHEGPVNALLMNGSQLISGGKDGVLKVWDPATSAHKASVDLKTEKGKIGVSVSALAFNSTTNQVFAGTKQSEIFAVQLDDKKVESLTKGHFAEFWGLATHPTQPLFATTGQDKTVRLWNSDKRQAEKLLDVEVEGFSLDFSPNGKYLAVGLTNAQILVVDVESFKVVHVLKDSEIKSHEVRVDDVKFSPDGTLLAAGYHNGLINIFGVENFDKKGTFKGSSSYLTHLDWSTNGKALQSDSGSYEHLFWDMEDFSMIGKSSLLRDTLWHSYTCTLGWPVKGIWSKGMDGTDINAAARSHGGNVIATGDDFGNVKLFSFPSLSSTKFREYEGHSSHVTNVRFTAGDSHLISAGGNDRFIFQWKCSQADPDASPPVKTPASETPQKQPGGATKTVTGQASKIPAPSKGPATTTPQKASGSSSKAPTTPGANKTPSKDTPATKNNNGTQPPRSGSSLNKTSSSTPLKSSTEKISSPPSQSNKSSSQFVTLSLDGKLFQTTLETLTKVKSSELANLFSQPQSLDRDAHGHFLLDLDPTHFGPILNYLRYGRLVLESSTSKAGVLACAEHLQLQEVVDLLK